MGFFKYPWATNGDTTTISQTTNSDGTVSYQEGFGSRYSYAQNVQSALPLSRRVLNTIFGRITEEIKQYQTIGFPNFITSSDNGGVAYQYAVGAVVHYTDGVNYINTIDGNAKTPSIANGWLPLGSNTVSGGGIVANGAVAKMGYFSGVNNGVISIRITGLVTATSSSVDLGLMKVIITQDDRDRSSPTNPPTYELMIKGNMDAGVWYNTQAIMLGATNETAGIHVRFTRTATDAYVEIGDIDLAWSYATVDVYHFVSFYVAGFSPSVSISLQNSLLGITATDRTIFATLSAQKLATPRKINGVPFDGSADVNTLMNPVTTNIDFNAVAESGFFTIGAGCTNHPSGARQMASFYWNANNAQQFAWDATGALFSRNLQTSGWTQWVKFQKTLSPNFGLPDYTAGIAKSFAYETIYTTTAKCRIVLNVGGQYINGAAIMVCPTGIGTPTVIVCQVGDDINSNTKSATLIADLAANTSYKITANGFSGGYEAATFVEYPLITT